MNWTKFQTYGLAPDKAFEMLCNQLFENWCREEYELNIDSFNVVNGAGGDGGVESYLTLIDGSVVGLQAKWFLDSMSSNQISQIRNSINTAMKIRNQIVRYIVCVPRDLSSKTARSENTEDMRWNNLVLDMKKDYPTVTIELWNETRLVTELQKSSSAGIYKFWFENVEISDENIVYAFSKAKNSWLSTKYVPDLNTFGEMEKELSLFLGKQEERKVIVEKFSRAINLCSEFVEKSNDLLEVCKDKDLDFREKISDAQNQIRKIYDESNKIVKWMKQEDINDLEVIENKFRFSFDSLQEYVRKSDVSQIYYFHTYEVIKTLSALSKIDFYELIDMAEKSCVKQSVLFIGNPGTGKTHGITAFSERILSEKIHAPLLLPARDVPDNYSWKDMVSKCLELSSTWSEDEIWQSLTSMVNRHKFSDNYISSDIKVLPKVMIVVDGLDESSAQGRWIERIKECNVIVSKYPQLRFCFTTRPSTIKKPIDYAQIRRLNSGGDVPVYKLFDSYMEKYNIDAKNQGWLKHALATPLALKLFCELNANKTIGHLNNAEISLTELWRRKIDIIEEEYCEKEHLVIQNQYVFKTIVYLANMFIDNSKIEREMLIAGIISKLSINRKQTENILVHLENYGALSCYCEVGTGLMPNVYYYYPGIQGYFDYASAIILLEEYGHPENIGFDSNKVISTNTLYGLAIISMQKYDYLITRNRTIRNAVDEGTISEIQFFALQHTNSNNGKQFVKRSIEIMKESADGLITIVNRVVLPLSRELDHPLGASLLNNFLKSFGKPAQRDILWSVPGYLRDSRGKKWYQSESLNLEDDEYALSQEDLYNGCPLVYAWALSSVNNPLRKTYRNELMKWSQLVPTEFWKLFLEFSNVNDPQIKEEMFSILTCLVYDGADEALIKEISRWIAQNILNPIKIDENRDIAIRYYSIAIMKKAESINAYTSAEIENFLPPYHVSGYNIALNKEALKGTRMGGYSAIDYDLSRYVLIDHIESDFNSYYQKKNNQIYELIETIVKEKPDFKGMTVEQFILSAAYAYILEMGWNEKEFYNYGKDEDGNIIGGVDNSIIGTHYPATHGSKSSVMTVCEKYVWQARKNISGFLCDRLLYSDENIKVTDYGMLEDFIIPVQEMQQIDPDNIPEDRPWHIPEREIVILDSENGSAENVIKIVKETPDIDWEKWIFVDNLEGKYKIEDNRLLGLSSYSCFFGSAGVETCLFVNSVLVVSKDVKAFVKEISRNREKCNRVSNPTDWYGGIESSCYITPKEICWFPWKKRYDSPYIEEFSEIRIHSAVDECCYNYLEYGDVHYDLPSAPLREILGICDSNGYEYIDNSGQIKAEYTIAGEQWGTYQSYLVVSKDELLNKLAETPYSMVWIMMELRRESGIAKEKYGDFSVDRRKCYVGYFDDGEFIVKEILSEVMSSTKNLEGR